jgi:hypothetical protein
MKEELKIKDVMVGDWIDVRNEASPNSPHLERITPSHFLRNEHWYGVELVPRILEKNGLEKDNHGRLYGEYFDEDINRDLEITVDSKTGEVWWSYNWDEYWIIRLKYVHQLQHALRLCGIDKTIEL